MSVVSRRSPEDGRLFTVLQVIGAVFGIAGGISGLANLIHLWSTQGAGAVGPEGWVFLAAIFGVVLLLFVWWQGWRTVDWLLKVWWGAGLVVNWARIHRSQLLAPSPYVLLLILLVWRRYAVPLSVVANVLLAVQAWLVASRVQVDKTGRAAARSLRDRAVFLSDGLRAPTLDHSQWHVTYGSPTMLFPTEQGLVITWRSGRHYLESGQIVAPLADEPWRVSATLLARQYGSGWDAGLYIYGEDRSTPLIAVGFMPPGFPTSLPEDKANVRQLEGLAIAAGCPSGGTWPVQRDKVHLPVRIEAAVEITFEDGDVTVSFSGRDVWAGNIEGTPRELCVGAYRWPRPQDTVPADHPSAEYVIRDITGRRLTER